MLPGGWRSPDSRFAGSAARALRATFRVAAVAIPLYSYTSLSSTSVPHSITRQGARVYSCRIWSSVVDSPVSRVDSPRRVCVFSKLLGPSPGPQGVGLPTRDTGAAYWFGLVWLLVWNGTGPRYRNGLLSGRFALAPSCAVATYWNMPPLGSYSAVARGCSCAFYNQFNNANGAVVAPPRRWVHID